MEVVDPRDNYKQNIPSRSSQWELSEYQIKIILRGSYQTLLVLKVVLNNKYYKNNNIMSLLVCVQYPLPLPIEPPLFDPRPRPPPRPPPRGGGVFGRLDSISSNCPSKNPSFPSNHELYKSLE